MRLWLSIQQWYYGYKVSKEMSLGGGGGEEVKLFDKKAALSFCWLFSKQTEHIFNIEYLLYCIC